MLSDTTAPGGLPFRVGATSFIYPGDWLYNVERLAGRVGDIELLFFEADGLPAPEYFAQLAAWKSKGHSYTVHTPLSASLASEDEQRRQQGIEEVIRVIEASRPVEPFAWILHVYWGDFEGDKQTVDLGAWQHRAMDSLRTITDRTGEHQRLSIESLDYDYRRIGPVVEALDLTVAWDIGHDIRDQRQSQFMIEELHHRLRVVQWHGTDPADRDHRSLAFVPPEDSKRLLQNLSKIDFAGVVTLEVFREDDFEESLALAHKLIAAEASRAR